MSLWNSLIGTPYHQTFYDAGGIRTRVIEAGFENQMPLIFLHGTTGHAEGHVKNIAAHAEHFHVYAIDLIGHGFTDNPDIDYGMQYYVDHLLAFMDAIGAEKAHIAGQSMGGSIAAWFAMRHPERVAKLTMNTGVPMQAPADRHEGMRERVKMSIAARDAGTVRDREWTRARLGRLMLNPDVSVTEELVDIRLMIYQDRPKTSNQITISSISGLFAPDMYEEWYNPANLQKIESETLLIWTEHNPGQPLALAQKVADLIPNAELAVIDNAAHWPQWENPEQYNKVHLEFLLRS